MQPSPLARALESLLGPWLSPLASALRLGARIALAAGLILAAFRIVAAIAAWKYGWERATVVRCPRCRRLAVDPKQDQCPSGHPVRFPPRPFAAAFPEMSAVSIPAGRALTLALALASAAIAIWAYRTIDPGRARLSLTSVLAAASFLFFAAGLYCAHWSLSPSSRGVIARLVHAVLAILFGVPSLSLFLLAQVLEPPPRELLGAVWTTPAATYISLPGHRGKRLGPASSTLAASLVEASVPALGVVWQGVDQLEVGGNQFAWPGAGGFLARRLNRWASDLPAHDIWLSRLRGTTTLSPGVRVWIVRERRKIVFRTEEELEVPEIPSTRSPSTSPL